ncbi:thioredoxin-like protein [Atractiella rhizophila]|nr:thioredoxin-like protein [Atractiella rhizophila]
MATKIKITYFPVCGYLEPIRLLLEDAGAEYEDYRFKGPQDWESHKSAPDWGEKCPFGLYPVLEYDDFILPESGAILRFLASEYGYVPPSPKTTALVEALYGKLMDLHESSVEPVKSGPEEFRKWFEETLPVQMDRVEGFVKKWNEDGEGFLLGTEKPSIADFRFFDIFFFYRNTYSKVFDNHTRLRTVFERMMERPGIKEYLDSGRRPKIQGGYGSVGKIDKIL